LHEAEAQLDARHAVSNGSDRGSIFVRDPRYFRRGYGDEQHIFVQDMVAFYVLRKRERYAFGHTAEDDRDAGYAKWRIAVEVFDKLLRTLANFEANSVHNLLTLAPREHEECDDHGNE